jgi:hypothetical protein
MLFGRLIVASVLVLAACDRGDDSVTSGPTGAPPPAMMVGLSNMSADITKIAGDLGIRWARQTIGWDTLDKIVEPNGLSLEAALSDQALLDFCASHDFSEADSVVLRFTGRGIAVLGAVGSGWSQAIPVLEDGRPAAPDAIGRDEYLARQVLVTRAIVERYDGDGWLDAPGHPRVQIWQVENELNEAAFTAFGAARWPSGVDALSSSWVDPAYVDHLFHTLVLAVRAQDASALVTTNLHTSVSANLDRAIGILPWDEQLMTWLPDLDWIGLDSYPNYVSAWPLETDAVGEAVARAVALGGGRPVVIIETGYPSGPVELGYDEQRQALFMLEAFSKAEAAGAIGLFWYGTRGSETTSVEITERDRDTIGRLGEAYASGSLRDLMNLMLEDRDYFQTHFAQVMSADGAYWGLVDHDGRRKPSWTLLEWEARYH